jgi:hypothetical protein
MGKKSITDKNVQIMGYHSTQPTWRVKGKSDYKKNFNHSLAVFYLKHEIYESIDREMAHLLSSPNSGFYAGIRYLFAEVTYLSHLYWGKKSNYKNQESRYVAKFMKKFKILPPEYGLHYEIFRHGLMHTHHAKWLKKRHGVINWYVSNVAKIDNMFGVSIPEFNIQVKKSVEIFISELEAEEKMQKRTRLNKFFEGYIKTAKILTKKDLPKYLQTYFSKVPTGR